MLLVTVVFFCRKVIVAWHYLPNLDDLVILFILQNGVQFFEDFVRG
jgi:hypothetical protein